MQLLDSGLVIDKDQTRRKWPMNKNIGMMNGGLWVSPLY